METIEYRTIDKSAWPDGEWKNEPDKMQWQDKETGLPCLIVRNGSGALCGYVGVTEDHPCFDKSYDEVYEAYPDVEVHGGLTFTNFCTPGEEDRHICHKPSPGEPDHVFWLGFDCGHCDDLIPAYPEEYRLAFRVGYQSYKDLSYVQDQCAFLAKQLEEIRINAAKIPQS